MSIKEGINHKVIERTSNGSFQALWIELQFPKKTNVICAQTSFSHRSLFVCNFFIYICIFVTWLLSFNINVKSDTTHPDQPLLFAGQCSPFILIMKLNNIKIQPSLKAELQCLFIYYCLFDLLLFIIIIIIIIIIYYYYHYYYYYYYYFKWYLRAILYVS